jgi:hypothetical protein
MDQCSQFVSEVSIQRSRDIVFHLTQNIVELPICDIAFHLLVPLVIFPAVEPSRQLGPLFKQELFYCRFDLLDAHWNGSYRIRRQASTLASVGLVGTPRCGVRTTTRAPPHDIRESRISSPPTAGMLLISSGKPDGNIAPATPPCRTSPRHCATPAISCWWPTATTQKRSATSVTPSTTRPRQKPKPNPRPKPARG